LFTAFAFKPKLLPAARTGQQLKPPGTSEEPIGHWPLANHKPCQRAWHGMFQIWHPERLPRKIKKIIVSGAICAVGSSGRIWVTQRSACALTGQWSKNRGDNWSCWTICDSGFAGGQPCGAFAGGDERGSEIFGDELACRSKSGRGLPQSKTASVRESKKPLPAGPEGAW